ncbi:MAG: 50S ribosomal protein L15 [Candidatus Kerfeldbacteria bacterium CG08_land_8_20_14_0_20_40_16]|uniref:Large ribosomal subunit protein uL15 n=1 Tax=Candidatus Kerfeldbacteria bacterium CG08_land_8_20_14_0_20_40_16 TaxID=2014244 RepID=A0A2H0YUT5_9BACT|nr:MAG: 50S ribosomal protein L15 [Candidatus Kerfeldbacteria bacterium CG08_land_8_20_14_0_20_40_16]
MALSLSQLKSHPSSQKRKKRVGRGNSSKGGTYGGRGQKGQKSRSGGRRKAGHRGKKSPAFISQIPKARGFKSISPKMNIVNIGQLNNYFSDGETINLKKLLNSELVANNGNELKVLGGGELKKKFIVTAHRFSKSAEDAIKKAGGAVNIIKKAPDRENKKKLDNKK